MGLCKCRVVTNLFCFDHKCNVCEKCLVEDHPRCIVRSYLQWLQDSEYESICTLCRGSLQEGDVVRLICYDVFHWECLDRQCRAMPANTAPAGYVCPTCTAQIIPQPDLQSPVAQVVRNRLTAVLWGKLSAGLPPPFAQPAPPKVPQVNGRPEAFGHSASPVPPADVTRGPDPGFADPRLIRYEQEPPTRYASSTVQIARDSPQPITRSHSTSAPSGSFVTRWKRRLGIRPIALMGRDFSRVAVLLMVVLVMFLLFRHSGE
eukprot:comp20443_c1_seq1/m.25989 comp20443_c1_seq1/g.25989  ORF comp20443_c1_seq1/g.25989 comp20443_c1_seq1/m.25989 type:complete len:261 (-) comp20443_c1_seq1:317-1099(-)